MVLRADGSIPPARVLCLNVKVGFQRFYVTIEGCLSLFCDSAGCLRHLSLESLADCYVFSLAELVELYADVAGCGSGLLLYVAEIGMVSADEYGHYRQPQFGVE